MVDYRVLLFVNENNQIARKLKCIDFVNTWQGLLIKRQTICCSNSTLLCELWHRPRLSPAPRRSTSALRRIRTNQHSTSTKQSPNEWDEISGPMSACVSILYSQSVYLEGIWLVSKQHRNIEGYRICLLLHVIKDRIAKWELHEPKMGIWILLLSDKTNLNDW